MILILSFFITPATPRRGMQYVSRGFDERAWPLQASNRKSSSHIVVSHLGKCNSAPAAASCPPAVTSVAIVTFVSIVISFVISLRA